MYFKSKNGQAWPFLKAFCMVSAYFLGLLKIAQPSNAINKTNAPISMNAHILFVNFNDFTALAFFD